MRILNLFVLIIIFTFALIPESAQAQSITFGVDFLGFADNREYKNPYVSDKTIFGSRISPSFTFQLSDEHKIVGGVHFFQDFGAPKSEFHFRPIAYYNYSKSGINFYIGQIPRYNLLKDIPLMVHSDTLNYYRPNIEGMLFSIEKKAVKQSIWIDWTSKQSDVNKEQFILGTDGKFKFSDFYIANTMSINHLALTSNDEIDEHVQDNGIIMLRLGWEKSQLGIIDSLSVEAGMSLGLDRLRSVYDWQVNRGFIASGYIEAKNFFAKNTLYLGDPQQVLIGDPFYKNTKYDRAEIGWIPFRTSQITGRFSAILHITPGFVDSQQQFTLHYVFKNKLKK